MSLRSHLKSMLTHPSGIYWVLLGADYSNRPFEGYGNTSIESLHLKKLRKLDILDNIATLNTDSLLSPGLVLLLFDFF